ncbi:hypothetical protein A3H38_02785 [candidate division WOR-1 bacterium RIFCSPLOWO2_02_FULL_46_20]|uniref:Response regulatory domain-containing protein n=2 Tax=Saganbacteria TaxID=1703751 RepID=A0A1F4R8Y7_UNCSA|nr:MAG: hypothetical protein A3J44_05985 [candidate division WOR-1 bacterium RIFCSPHIGHO2_02_FULL_45_12]OGC04576.1 MAG: hypothetical protein A3H38_02785 [candidate division WOR-1 bacterium RIFCSPLOWO2_02_FULL_46_20]OGC08875.1 MAG: hypothetical protein A3F86_00025 [candidate division WOR-1 bacterium RIFCSPLOWO2_12_FULL_45_9]
MQPKGESKITKPKILIIDDDDDLVAAMKMVLEHNSYQVVSASSGTEGLIKAKNGNPDLVILDVMMETSDSGFEVARKIRGEAGIAKVPILMVTAIKEKTGFDFSKEAGDKAWLPVDNYLEKPIRPDELVSKVAKLLNK